MVLAVVLVLLAIGSVVFHIWSPWWFTPLASNWGSLDDAIVITFWITGVAYVAVILFMAYCVYRYRYRKNRRADYEPENTKLEWWLTWVTAAGVVGLLTPGLIAWNDFVTVPKGTPEFEVLGQQWSWNYRLPGRDGKLGTTNAKLINDDNPFGIDPNDANGTDDVLIEGDDLHLQLGHPPGKYRRCARWPLMGRCSYIRLSRRAAVRMAPVGGSGLLRRFQFGKCLLLPAHRAARAAYVGRSRRVVAEYFEIAARRFGRRSASERRAVYRLLALPVADLADFIRPLIDELKGIEKSWRHQIPTQAWPGPPN
jgi:heme/copper-type cytochrome/quinol oxidase subunit 2|tara:strand:+ start:83 stop:1015 length:933 start_codon:yes stop_codon:yes gene_type:complete